MRRFAFLLFLPLLLPPALARANLPTRPLDLAELPDDFAESLVVRDLSGATAFTVAPDGRVFLCEQTGALRVLKEGKLLSEPFVRVAVDSTWERGLIGVTLDPAFPKKPYVYVCYVADKPCPHHRVSRFTAKGDRAVPGSEVVLLEGDDQRKLGGAIPAGHQGGPIAFGPDGKLYVAVGEQTAGAPSQRLDSFLGKLLRINADGSIPADNPFVGKAKGKYRAIWALGLRNPFGLAFQARTGRLFVNDVGGSRWEEINEVRAGGNYGWPLAEGPAARPGLVDPLHAYHRGVGRCVAGGTFYDPPKGQFPERYRGKYFFCDFMDGWIRVLDPARPGGAGLFARGLRGPVDVRVAPDGSLYVLERNAWVKDGGFRAGTGALRRILYAPRAGGRVPRLTAHPADAVVAPGQKVVLRARAEGAGPLSYQWLRDGKPLPETGSSLTITAPPSGAARYRCVVRGSDAAVRSRQALVRVEPLRAPAHVTRVLPGLEVQVCEIGDLADLDRLERAPLRSARRVEPAPRPRDKGVAFRYRGLLHVPADGCYVFSVQASGPAWLKVAEGPTRLTTADRPVGLRKGLHEFSLVLAHLEGVPRLRLSWSGPGVDKGEVPADALYRPALASKESKLIRPAALLNVPADPARLPARLSGTGLFRRLADLTPAAVLRAYEVNSPLWSDGAAKRRWIAVPGGGVRFRPRGEWSFPAGTVFVKHFELPAGKGPARRLETRLLVTGEEGLGYGATYKWRPDGRDADLLQDGLTESLGKGRSWAYPSRGDCLVCHTTTAGFVLGVNTRQLNRTIGPENQLRAWSRAGLFEQPLNEKELSSYPRLAALDDVRAPLEVRVRSYLDANCAFCHRPGGSPGEFDARFDTPLPRQKLLTAPLVAADLGLPGVRLVTPGDPERSMLYLRMKRRRDVFNMPPLASLYADEEALAVLAGWIRERKGKK